MSTSLAARSTNSPLLSAPSDRPGVGGGTCRAEGSKDSALPLRTPEMSLLGTSMVVLTLLTTGCLGLLPGRCFQYGELLSALSIATYGTSHALSLYDDC